ncbi:hypothetical protein HLB23_28340 [Nocardia uniformis]|uniref:Uncharacterized protein n=1 Tax=Nocardia uniformis TaxID=53432 RepID=A0A849CCE1_9NOCA|nr:hypothetical protein [Nocardia uniformis]NNH73717.1 hypothetical protein [Nocardia uniformis]
MTKVITVGRTQHWHFGTYRAIAWPPDLTAEFSPAFPTSAAAKAEIVGHVCNDVTSDEGALQLIQVAPQRLRELAREWGALPDELFLHYFPWIQEIFPCEGDCAAAAYANAVEMTEWLTDNGVVDAEVAGSASEFSLIARQPSGNSRFSRILLAQVDSTDGAAGV